MSTSIEITTPLTNSSEFTNGLRALCDLLDEHNATKSYDDYCYRIYVRTREELVDVVRTLGGKWTKDENPNDYFGMTRDLGGGVTINAYLRREQVCKAVVVGKRTVQRPAPDAPMVDVEEDVVEWRCPDTLLASKSQPVDCPACGGGGRVRVDQPIGGVAALAMVRQQVETEPCDVCEGFGQVPA